MALGSIFLSHYNNFKDGIAMEPVLAILMDDISFVDLDDQMILIPFGSKVVVCLDRMIAYSNDYHFDVTKDQIEIVH